MFEQAPFYVVDPASDFDADDPTLESAATSQLARQAIRPDAWDGQEPPPRRWLVEGLIPKGTLTLFSGDGGLGKSLLCQQLQTCAALGEPWLGVNTRQCATVALYCEDPPEELQRRQHGIMRHHGRRHTDLGGRMTVVSRVDSPDNALADVCPRTGEMTASQLLHDLEQLAIDRGAELILIDPAVAVYPGDEIKRRDVRRFGDLLKALAHRTDAAVVLTAHPSRAGLSSGDGLSGSTDWNNVARSRLYLADAKPDDEHERVITTPKANWGPRGDRLELAWQNGLFVRTNTSPDAVDRIEQASAETVFLRCLAEAREQGFELNARKNAATYAPREIAQMPGSQGYTVATLEKAMRNLLHQRRIRQVRYGPPSRNFHRLEITNERDLPGSS